MKESADLFKILSVDKRIEIIELLKKEPMSVNALSEALGITQSAVSQHLRVVILNNLIQTRVKIKYPKDRGKTMLMQQCKTGDIQKTQHYFTPMEIAAYFNLP